jgi:hypothetical protein
VKPDDVARSVEDDRDLDGPGQTLFLGNDLERQRVVDGPDVAR